ncbi:hypothetical protein ACTXJX_16440 [Glutamicibacter ardleyensis]|uniref:hypothetical protein n=1 Tax=Glutamicibacter ardleyensis TaxID=225894 RepID=UPI003FD4E92B
MEIRNNLLGSDQLDSISHKLCNYFVANSVSDHRDRSMVLIDSELGRRASDCSTLQVSSFLSYFGLITGDKSLEETGAALFRSIDFNEPFRGVYNVRLGEEGLFDLAEAGAGLACLDLIGDSIVQDRRDDLVNFARKFVLESVSTEVPGAFYKNVNATGIDVLNGDVYAALILGKIHDKFVVPSFVEYIQATVEHLISRFDVTEPHGWPYSEAWDGKLSVGFSTAYQATIVGWGALLSKYLTEAHANQWKLTLWSAQKRIISAIEADDVESNEAPSWARNWDNIWEIDLSFARWNSTPCISRIQTRLANIEQELSVSGIAAFNDKRSGNPDRSPLGSTMRKASNFASVLSSILTNSQFDINE